MQQRARFGKTLVAHDGEGLVVRFAQMQRNRQTALLRLSLIHIYRRRY